WYRSRHRFEAWWKSRPRRQRGGRPRKKLWPTPGGNATDRGSDGPRDCGCEKWAYGQYSFRAHFSAAPVGGKQSVNCLTRKRSRQYYTHKSASPLRATSKPYFISA